MEAALLISEEDAHSEWLETVYQRHARNVIQTAYRVTGNPEDAEDVLQTVFMRLAGRHPHPDLSGGALPYLKRSAINAALDILRSKSHQTIAAPELIRTLESRDPNSAPDGRLHSSEIKAQLRLTLSRVNRRNAEMFILRYFEDLKLKRIAEIFNTTPGSVAVTLHRVRAQIKEELGVIQ